MNTISLNGSRGELHAPGFLHALGFVPRFFGFAGLFGSFRAAYIIEAIHRVKGGSSVLRSKRLWLFLFTVLAAPTVHCAENPVTPSMSGHWEGEALIVVEWCKQRRLSVVIDIQPDGTVTGKVGDAVLKVARFTRNRGVVGRTLDLGTDYIVQGELKGAIVAGEGVVRSRAFIPLNFRDDRFAGGVHTSGAKFGGKRNGILSAASLKLVRKQ